MNLDSEGNCWICYYSDFPVVKIDPHGNLQAWRCPISGSHTLHIHEGRIIMDGGYGKEHFRLLAFEGTQLTKLNIVKFKSSEGIPLTKRNHITSARSLIGFWAGNSIYLTEMATWPHNE
jgi:hypothetical protein